MRLFLTILVTFLITSCSGYKPIPNVAKSVFAEPVLVNVTLNEKDPESGKYIEDVLTQTVINRLNLQTTKKVKDAKSYIVVTIYAVNTSPANKDDEGNVIRYSVNAAIKFAVKDRYGFWYKNIVTNQYVSVKAKSLLSENEKSKAEKIAINKAMDAFVAAVAQRAKEMANKKNDNNQTQNSINTETESMNGLNNQEYQEEYTNNIENESLNSNKSDDSSYNEEDNYSNSFNSDNNGEKYYLGDENSSDYVEIKL